ncbi:MAG: aldehyde ferredoxin oxidoreductase family protein [Chloroflexota bacterium]|nr:aldehyde ferredoxin oxidoreductase family protein [Chloroflexota bacterium]
MSKLLIVNLTTGEIKWTELPETLVRQFLGGRGINACLLARYVGPTTDPLGPENVLVLSCGLLTGTQAPASSRLHLGARSPLTGLLGSSNVGGHFGAELRAAGVQALLIQGHAQCPVTLRIEGDQVELLDAAHLWGLDSRTVAGLLQAELGRGVKLAVIGVGGENQVRYACVMTGDRHAAGRTGLGAVMGSKNLKAIAVRRGKRRSEYQGPAKGPRDEDEKGEEAIRLLVRDYVDRIRTAPRYETYARFSNSAFVKWADESGLLATRNYQHVRFEGVERIDGERLIEYVTRPRSCHRCPVHCKAEIEIREGRYGGARGERPDIEPIVNLGAKCGLDDPEAVLYLYNLAGTLGIDAISTGGVLAFAMELYERGILSPEDTDGIELTWGNAEAMEAMMRRISQREGFGTVLAEGVRRAAQMIGQGAEAYAYHSKGLELTAYDPRGGMGTALGYAVSTRGGDFTSVYAVPEYRWEPEQGREWFGTEKAADRLSTEGKGRLVKRTMIVSAVLDALGICKVPVLSVVGDYSLENEAALTAALTGWDMDADELALVGERIINLERLFNLRHGASREDDDLPDRFTEERVSDPGPTQGMTVEIRRMVGDFYAAMGWDEEGHPTLDKLDELDLELVL